MVENVWAVFCKRAIEDRNTNNLTLLEGIQQFNVEVTPDAEGPFNVMVDGVIATLWVNMDADKSAKFSVDVIYTWPNGKAEELHSFNMQIKPETFGRYYINVKDITLYGEGMHRLDFMLREEGKRNRKRVAVVPFRVKFNIREDAASFERVS